MPLPSSELPSSQDLESAANDDASSVVCRQLVLDALSYGTKVHDDSETRIKQTSDLLANVWERHGSLEDTLVDVFWLLSSMLPSDVENLSNKAVAEILKSLLHVPGRDEFWVKLQCNLPPYLLEMAGLASEEGLLKKLKVHNTQVNYKQPRYNLLQEESEGYSKLLHFLISGTEIDPTQRRKRLSQLIGIFELDPHRVLDLIVDILEAKLFPPQVGGSSSAVNAENLHVTEKPQTDAHILWLLDLMNEFSLNKLPALIGFKLSAAGDGQEQSPRLLQLIAFFATVNLLDLRTMMAEHFPPIDEDLKEAHKVHWMKEKRRIQALARVSLSGVQKEDPKQAELAQRLKKHLDPLEKSEVVQVLLILLEWREWELVKPLLTLERWSHLCTLLPAKFGFALCNIAHERMLPWYRSQIETPTLAKQTKAAHPTSSDVTNDHSGLTLDQVVEAIAEPLLCTVQSCCIGLQPILYCQICRIFRSLLNDDKDEHHLSDDAYMFFKKFLVPSLSLFPANPAISTELWSVLKRMPYSTRYRLYGDWRGTGLEKSGMGASATGKPLSCVESEMMAGKQTRYALKRLSKDNIRDMSRQLAKVTHSNPLVVFTTILNQIEAYDNMIDMMVEAQRFVGPLGLDVLGYCILSRLSGMSGGGNRSRLKEDGVNVSQWLQSMEAFSGSFYKRCPYVEFRGMLCYLMRRLRDGNVMELGILRTLLKTPGGYSFSDYSPAESLSITQLEGRAGSITLKRETMSFGIVEEVNYRASDRIRDVLQTDGFGVSMLILIAQVRSRILFESSKMPFKLVGNLYDSCQVVMSILLEFLTEASNEKVAANAIARYAESLPTLEDLHTRYGFDVVSAWTLCRPLLRAAKQRDSKKAMDGADDRLKKFELTEKARTSYMSMLPDSTWSNISPILFETFFANSLYDVLCPENVYTSEITRIGKEIERIQQRNRGGAASSLHLGVSTKNEGDELERLKVVQSALSADQSKQMKHMNSIHQSMQKSKSQFFPLQDVSTQAVSIFLTHCIFPRSTLGPDDAVYCARFVSLLHQFDTPGFSTLHYFDQLISAVAGALFGVTEGEAAHLAILLWETWKIVNKWRYDEQAFDAELKGRPGSFLVGSTGTSNNSDGESEAISYKDFASLYNKWHATLGTVLISCLQSSEYMHTRACLVILTRLVEVFPTRPNLGNKLLKVLAPLQDENSSRQDIRASANAYGTMLLKARDDGKWVEEDAAVAKARVEKERVAAEARKRKIAATFQAFERDNQKITEEIGPRDNLWMDRRRPPARDLAESRGASTLEQTRAKQHAPGKVSENGGLARGSNSEEQSASFRPATTRVESGELPGSRDRSRDHNDRPQFQRPSPLSEVDRARERDRGAAGDDRGRGRNEALHGSSSGWSGERPVASDGRRRDVGTTVTGGARDEPRGLGGRWTRSDAVQTDARPARGNKRSRPGSPELSNEGGREIRGAKRTRVTPSTVDYEPSRTERASSPPPRRRGGSPARSSPPAAAPRPAQRQRNRRR